MHMSDPIGHMMTDSVKLICLYVCLGRYMPINNANKIIRDIEAELNTMEERQGSDTERRLVNALSGIDVAMEGWRQIEAHLRRLNVCLVCLHSVLILTNIFQLNLNLNVLRGMSGQATVCVLTLPQESI
jgi:hypothetical protein